MNTAYNNNTTVQESRNRYNQLLQAALKRINDRKSNKDAEEVTTTEATATTPTQQPEPVATPEDVTSKSRRQIIEEMRSEPTEKFVPWYFRYFNYLKTKPARDIEAIETEARNLRTRLEKRIKAGRKGFYYEIETFNTAEEYASVIIELYSAKARKDGNISEKEMYDIIGKQIRYAIEEFDKTGDRFTTVTAMSIEFRNHPAPAPQATEEDTTTAPEATAETPVQEPEEVTTEEDATPAPATDDATLLRNLIDQYGNVGADYLDTLDYSQATEIRSDDAYILGRAKDLKQIEYRIGPADKNGRCKPFGLRRIYARNGKRMNFSVHNGWKCMESRAYGKNNNHYKAEIFYDGNKLKYLVKNGVIVEALLVKGRGAIIHVHFNDTNRPATPRDLPAPAPTKTTSKKTTKEEPATTKQEQPTSTQAPTPEATTVPEEVKEVTTSNQENGPVPYWLLLDQELRAQQEEQEQETTPATPEKSEEEPMHAPQMLKKIIEEKKRRAAEGTNTTPLKTAVGMTTEVLTKKRAKELLGDDASDYNTYILVDGTYVVRFDRPELSTVLYIDDESKEYKEYQRRNISAVELWRNDAMRLHNPARDLDTIKLIPYCLKVLRSKNNVLEFSKYGDARYGYRRVTPDEVEIYKAAAIEASEAFTKRLDSYIRRYGKKIYVHSYWANR